MFSKAVDVINFVVLTIIISPIAAYLAEVVKTMGTGI